MACKKCQNIVDRKDLPHVIRKCENCGRVMYIHEPLKHGKGLIVKNGERLVIPKDWLSLSFDPLKSRGHFTRYGLNWFAQRIFIEDYPKDKSKIRDELQKIEKRCDTFLSKSTLLTGLDIVNPDHAEKIFKILETKKNSAEWWALLTGIFLSFLNGALEKNDIDQAIWAMSGVERFRSMFIFKEHLEGVVWMGHSAKKVVEILRIWNNNKKNKNERFWQRTFKENLYVLSQVFAVSIVFIQDQAYVGGMKIDRKDAKFVDYFFSIESSKEAALIEIKTPTAPLLGKKYRSIYKPSSELCGSIVQVLEYRKELPEKIYDLIKGTKHDISVFNPKCAVIIGNAELELKNDAQRRSFELFRGNLKDVEIVTYDELFRKAEVLANLFNLVQEKAKNH